jgi:hypothetical protein
MKSIAKDVHGIISLEAVIVDMMYCSGKRKREWGSVAELEICSYVCHI